MTDKRNRYLYVKPRNVAEELRSLQSMPALAGGPEAYVAHFLAIVGDAPALLMSFHSSPSTDDAARIGNVVARSVFLPRGLSLRTLASRLYTVARLFAHALRYRPTHVLCWQSELPSLVCYSVARINRAVFVPTRHTRFPDVGEPWHRRLAGSMDKWVLRRSAAVICHGPYLREQLLQIGIEKPKIIEFNWSFRHLLEQPVGNGGDRKVAEKPWGTILYVGRIVTAKGVFDLLTACGKMLRENTALRLVYAGDGPDLERLRTYAAALDVADRITFLGRVRHDKLAETLRHTTLLVAPTQRSFPEGRCMAVIEGLILGVPVVAPDFGPFPYLVRHRYNGMLYRPDSVSALADAIRSALYDKELYKMLQEGATESAKILLNPPIGFREAVQHAFERARPSAPRRVDAVSNAR